VRATFKHHLGRGGSNLGLLLLFLLLGRRGLEEVLDVGVLEVVQVGGDAVGAWGQAVTLLQLFWGEETPDWRILINILSSILIFAHNSFLPLLFDFLLPGLLLLYGLIIIIVIFECGKLILRYGIKVQVNVNALFVEEDLAKVKLISLVSAVAPGAAEEEAAEEAKGCVDCPRAPEVNHLHRLLQT
jgi:hypothetical protein